MSEEARINLDSMSEEEVESEAKAMGWVPQEEFRGDVEKHVDAKTFLERGQNYLPIVRKERDEYKRELQEVKGQMGEMKKTFEEFSTFHRNTVERTERQAYEKALADINARQKEAVANADVDEWEQLEKEKSDLAPPRS